MDLRKAMVSLLQLAFTFWFFIGALVFLKLGYSLESRIAVAYTLLSSASACRIVGLMLLGASFFFLIGFCFVSRGGYFQMKSYNCSVKIKDVIFRKTLEHVCAERFGKSIRLSNCLITRTGKMKLEIEAEGIGLNGRSELLNFLNEELPALIEKNFGYVSPFSVSVKVLPH